MDTWLDTSLCVRLAIALGHSLWQGTLVALVAWLTVSATKRAAPTFRYGIWCAALAVMVACLPITFALLGGRAETAPKLTVAVSPPPHVESAPIGTLNGSQTPRAVPPLPTEQAPPAPVEIRQPSPSPHPPASTPSPTFARTDIASYAPYVVLAYLLGVSVMLARISISLYGGQRLYRRSRPVTDGAVLAALARGAEALGLAVTPAIACCGRIAVPTVVGILRPTILLPLSFGSGLTPRQVEMLLIHELAHIRRYDHLINLLQRLVEAALFFHPAVWYVTRSMRVEREHCCDDAVLALGGAACEYAASLVHVAEQARRPATATSLAASGGPSPLGQRVNRLIDGSSHTPVRLTRGWVVATIALILISIGISTILYAQSPQPSKERDSALPEEPADNLRHGGNAELQERGQALLHRMAEANRYWLLAPPEAVKTYSYDYGRPGENPRHFAVHDPANEDAATRCGVTYNTAMRALAKDPTRAIITSIEEEAGVLRIAFRFEEMVRGDCGNGLAGSWYGYFNLGVTEGTLWLDAERKAPLELICNTLTERFGEYVEVDAGHYVPLNITVTRERPGKDRTHYDWKFRLYDPGLWLFDMSFYTLGDAEPVVATQTTNVRVNASTAEAASAKPTEATVLAESAEARQERTAAARGHEHVATVVEANRAWLLPPLAPRRGLAYDYRQEGQYRERVLFDEQGRIMVQLEGTKDGPEAPSRQRLFLPDGTEVTGNHGDAFLRETPPPKDGAGSSGEPLHRLRGANNLATGLGWDCALTRMARAPSDFQAERLSGEDDGTYRLVLQSRNRDTKIFTGTMLTFTSWAYMHDVRYNRSEIVCDAATHRPLTEKDYDAEDKLIASYTFSDYLEDSGLAAPGRIHGIVPYEKDGHDQTLEMDATFAFTRPGVWLLQQVHSAFHGDAGESTGTVTVLRTDAAAFQPLTDMVARLEATRRFQAQADSASLGPVVLPLEFDKPLAVWARADGADMEEEGAIVVRQARLEQPDDGALRVTLDLVSTAYWKEYAVAVNVSLRDADGITIATQSVTPTVRAERTPGTAQCLVEFPKTSGAHDLTVSATVEQLTGRYHGHGRWWRTRIAEPGDKPSGKRRWGPEQATGEPDTHEAGDIVTAWASKSRDDQREWLLLDYAALVVPRTIKIYETYNPGAVDKVTVFTESGEEREVWSGKDPTPQESGMGVSEIPVNIDFPTSRVKIYLDSPRVDGWNEIDAVGVVATDGTVHWAVYAEASTTYAKGSPPPRQDTRPVVPTEGSNESRSADAPAPEPGSDEALPDGVVHIGHVDETDEGKKSLAASGHAVRFERPERGRFVEAVQIFAGRYGHAEPPIEDFHLYLLNEERQVLADVPYPYALIERADMRWYTLRTPSIEVPETFYVALAFNPHQTKGIFLGFDESVSESHSLIGLPEDGYEPVDGKYDWMVRAYLAEDPSGEKGTQRLADWSPPVHVDAFEGCMEAKYDDGVSDGIQSYGGRGPAVNVDLADFLPQVGDPVIPVDLRLRGIRVYGSRYGSGYDPQASTIAVTVLDASGQALATEHASYGLFSYKQKWVDIVFDRPVPTSGPNRTKLTIALDPEAHRTKGVYFHYNENPPQSHSLVGTVEQGLSPLPDREWMIRAYFKAE